MANYPLVSGVTIWCRGQNPKRRSASKFLVRTIRAAASLKLWKCKTFDAGKFIIKPLRRREHEELHTGEILPFLSILYLLRGRSHMKSALREREGGWPKRDNSTDML